MQTSGPMCRWEQAWWCCGRYHTGPQMGPCTVEPVAGAEAWALARWATLREAQPVRPKQADLITLGQDWSVVLQTHPRILHQGNRHYHDWLSQAGFILVCVCVFTCGFIPVLTGNIRLHVGFPCLSEKIVFSSQDNGSSLLFHNGGILPEQAGALYSPYFQMCFSRLVVNIIYKVSFDDTVSYLETHIQSKLISSLILNTI